MAVANDPMPPYPYGLALLNVLFVGLGVGAVFDSIDTQLRHQLSGTFVLAATGGALWLFTRRSGHPIWVAPSDSTGGTLRGRFTTVAVIVDCVLIVGLFTIA